MRVAFVCLTACLLVSHFESISATDQQPTAAPTSMLRPVVEYEADPVSGIKVLWNPDFGRAENALLKLRVRAALLFDLELFARTVGDATWKRLEGARVLVSPSTDAPPPNLPSKGRGAGFHASAQWLKANGIDEQRKGAVEIYNADDYLDMRDVQPMMILHELTHVLHDRADASTNDAISGAFQAARNSGKYKGVPRIVPPRSARAETYAMTNAREYAAELAEAFWGRNDNFPFVRSELIAFDAAGCEAVARLWFTTCRGW